MDRLVESELLDQLPPGDRLALGSRGDLRRLNGLMGNAPAMARALGVVVREQPRRLVELGSGDGHFLYRVACRLHHRWKGTSAVLLDRVAAVSPKTNRDFALLGWRVETVTSDVFDWLKQQRAEDGDALVANLFLHHFSRAQLTELFGYAARRAQSFVAIEPRRSAWALAFSHLVGLIGCNRVTRDDAPVSVRAGFNGSELSQLWPGNGTWTFEERPIGLFSHLFVACPARKQTSRDAFHSVARNVSERDRDAEDSVSTSRTARWDNAPYHPT
jgi:hypothetical protein